MWYRGSALSLISDERSSFYKYKVRTHLHFFPMAPVSLSSVSPLFPDATFLAHKSLELFQSIFGLSICFIVYVIKCEHHTFNSGGFTTGVNIW